VLRVAVAATLAARTLGCDGNGGALHGLRISSVPVFLHQGTAELRQSIHLPCLERFFGKLLFSNLRANRRNELFE
jgi:hypothetical protein